MLTLKQNHYNVLILNIINYSEFLLQPHHSVLTIISLIRHHSSSKLCISRSPTQLEHSSIDILPQSCYSGDNQLLNQRLPPGGLCLQKRLELQDKTAFIKGGRICFSLHLSLSHFIFKDNTLVGSPSSAQSPHTPHS